MNEPLNARLRRIRQDTGLSTREVERRTGISNALLSQMETGKVRRVSADNLAALADLYGVTMDELYHGTGRAEPCP